MADERYGLHALRHASASLWIEQGNNPKQIQTLMGHSSITVTLDTYATTSPTAKPTSAPWHCLDVHGAHRRPAGVAPHNEVRQFNPNATEHHWEKRKLKRDR